MFKFKAQIHTYDKAAFVAQLSKNSIALRDRAAKAFIRAVFDALPTYSGAAKATLIPLARLVRMTNLRGEIRPIVRKNTKTKGISAGIAHGKGERITKRGRGIFGFRFEHTLFHYWLLENFNISTAKTATPMKTIEAGSKAFLAFMDANAARALPVLFDFTKVVNISV